VKTLIQEEVMAKVEVGINRDNMDNTKTKIMATEVKEVLDPTISQ